MSSQAERSTVVSVGRPTCRPPGAWDECAASTLSRRPGRLRAPGLLPVARTRARNSPAGQRDPTARRGRAARHHRLRIENWISSLKPGWLSQCLAEFRRRKLFEDRAKLQRGLFSEDAFKTALRRCRRGRGRLPRNCDTDNHIITIITLYAGEHRRSCAGAKLPEELAMPDLDQIKQGEQGARDRRARFARGRSGNPTDGVRAGNPNRL